MDLALTLGTVKVPSGTPDESATGMYEMLDVEETLIVSPENLKPMEPIVKPPVIPLDKPLLVPPPLMMGKIPSAMEAAILRPGSQISTQQTYNTSNIIVAQPVMRDLQKDLVTMVPSSVRRKTAEHPHKKQKVSKEDEYQKFMSQFE
jgi:hypothetical protein